MTVAEKSNEIMAIPAVLDLLDVTGHIVTIDAMECQRSIAKKIRDKGADYVLALKGNQGTLNDEVRLFLQTETAKPVSLALSDAWSEADAGTGAWSRAGASSATSWTGSSKSPSGAA